MQIVEFDLRGMGLADYEALCDELAPAFVQMPGLREKVWVIDADAMRAGGIYSWADPGACDSYLASGLFAAVQSDPALANLRMRRFDVLERPSAVTRGLRVPAVTVEDVR